MTSVLRRERQKETGCRQEKRRHRGEGDGKMKAEIGEMQPQAKEC